MASGNYSCFDVPVDLSLTGSQVSPTRKSRSESARSNVSSKVSTASKRSSVNSYSKYSSQATKRKPSSAKKQSSLRENSSSLAMTFPTKENNKSKQTDAIMSTNQDFLDSFFKQSPTKTKKASRNSPTYNKKKSSYKESRVFDIPDTARSESVCSDEHFSSGRLDQRPNFENVPTNFNESGSGDADVDYLKSYLSNMEKYKDSCTVVEPVIELPTTSLSNSNISQSNQSIPNYSSPSPVNAQDLKKEEEDIYLQNENVQRFRRNHSASKIQTWYRRHATRKKRNEALMKRMLNEKKEDMESNILRESLKLNHRTEEEKKKQREMREREARKQAIKELHEKRAAKKKKIRQIAEEEVEEVKKKVEAEKLRVRKMSSKSSRLSKVESDVDVQSRNNEEEADSTNTNLFTGDSHAKEKTCNVGKSQTTLDDVLETIKLLEEEPQSLKKPKSKFDEKLSWMDDLQTELQSNLSKTSSAPSAASYLLTEAKLQSINSFLDEVEKEDPPPLTQVDETDAAQQLLQAEEDASQITSEMLRLKLNLEEKTRSVNVLKEALNQQRALSSRQIKEQESEFNQRLKMQKDQYEAAIQRHLSFIDQLIDDKKVLNEKCEKLVTEMKRSEDKYQKKFKTLTTSHQTELQKSKDVLAAAEKLRREKWIDEKTKKIKEMTVKGLEPEIQRLISKHKEEMKKVKSIHEAELLRSDERAGQRYIRQTEELREQLEREKEAACAREREMARQRYEKQMEQEEIALQQQRKRLYSEVAEEKERLNQQVVRQRKELDELKQQIEANSRIASSALRDEFERSTDDLQRRHKDEMKSLHERLDIEKQAWQENYMKKQEAFMMQKERELKEAVRIDRDKEIEAAILRLEDDMHHQRGELDKTAENRIKRIRDKYEAELKEVERSEKQTQEKYNAMKTEFNDIESENLQLQSLCKQKEQEVTDMLKIKNKLVDERANVSDVIRQEFADRLVITDEENKRMKNELSELRARQRLELERISNEKEEELSEVHKRVRQAIIKKEETISQIREQYDAAVKRSEHLESLLEKQRKKLLGKKK